MKMSEIEKGLIACMVLCVLCLLVAIGTFGTVQVLFIGFGLLLLVGAVIICGVMSALTGGDKT